jgi:hypothetical protein
VSLSANALVTSDDVAVVLGQSIAGEDLPLIELTIEAVSANFRTLVNCDLVSAALAHTDELIDGSGRRYLYLPGWPVLTLTSVYEDDVLLVLNTDYYADLDEGILERAEGFKWTCHRRGVKAAYSSGYLVQPASVPTIPADLKLACAAQAIELWKKTKSQSWLKTSQTVGGQTINFSDKELIPFAETTLKRYWREEYE